MSKELTEKWKNKELVGGWYILEFENGSVLPVYYDMWNREFEFGWDWKISEVLDHWDYKELQRLKEDRERYLELCENLLCIEEKKWENLVANGTKEERIDFLRNKEKYSFLALTDKYLKLLRQLDIAIKSINSAAGFLTCMDDLSELSGKCNEQMALEELNKAIKQIEELKK